MTHPSDVLHISSGADPDTHIPICYLQWGHIAKAMPPDVILNTAHDLMAAAAGAEADIALVRVLRDTVKVPESVVAGVVRDVRAQRSTAPKKVALRIEAIAGYHTDEPYVHIHLGSKSGSMSPDEARAEAVAWIETATAAHIDARLHRALDEFPLARGDRAHLFRLLREYGGDTSEYPG